MLAPQAPGDIIRMMQSASMVLLGDATVGAGTSYGTIVLQTTTAAIPAARTIDPTTLTCTYDKTTFLVHDCKTTP